MTETTTPQAPVATPPAPAPRSGNAGFFAAVVATVALGLAGYVFYQQQYGHASTVQGYYVLDLQKLVTAKMAQVIDSNAANPAGEAKKMMDDLNRLLQEYGSTGVLVLKKDMVMSVTPDQEITDAVAARLGIDLTRDPRDVSRRLIERSLPQAPGPAAAAPAVPAAPAAAALPPAPVAAVPVPPANDPTAALPTEVRDLFAPGTPKKP